MSKETGIAILKAIMTVAGSFLIGHVFMGTNIDQPFLEAAGGILLSGFSIFWSIKDKTYTIESIQAFVRQILLFLGGLLVAAGKLNPDQLETWIALLLAIIPVIQSWLSKTKAAQLKTGQLKVQNLKSTTP